jgi:two-component sensor histidine kinase
MPIPNSPALPDPERLAALDSYGILDTVPERGYDDIVELARHICRTPVALVSLVTGERQWFKAKVGIEMCETPLRQSVCAHAVAERSLLIIPDLTADHRTADNGLVTGPPYIRFYAGAPLETSEGHILGTICVIDTAPRPEGLDADQISALHALARQVVGQLELRRTVAERDAGERRYRAIFDAVNAGFCIVDVLFDEAGRPIDYQFMETNQQFGAQTGISDAVGRTMREIAPDHEEKWFELYGGVALTGQPIRFEGRAGALGRLFDVHAFPAGGDERSQVGIMFTDVTATREAEAALREVETRHQRQRDLLAEELGHRLKNTFAMVQGIARQTLKGVSERAAVDAFNQRMMALSGAHDVLLHQNWTAAGLRATVDGVLRLHAEAFRFDLHGEDLSLCANAVLSLSLLLHELATNALKYGSLSVEHGRVAIDWEIDGGETPQFSLTWGERGGPPASPPERQGFGTRLIRMGLVGSGGADLTYGATGFVARFSAPLSRMTQS